ncbi:uncharacterized protein [Chironomus tepperi]|uniref:uncharacterized protein n=1 Tax=Chironomus tepperi TaxID=113505 RepID=UPI00391F6655
MNSIVVRNATKSYDHKNAVLNGLDLTVQTGSIYGLIGPSGCGKTTLLSSILGMMQLDGGTIRVLDQEVLYPRPSKFPHLIGFMPQETALVPELTIKETLYFFGNIFQMDQIVLKQRLVMICELLELTDLNKQVRQLSGGGKRRVSFAAALIHDPKILILDEPTVGLDSILREKIWTFLIDSTKSSDMAVIITTHYIAEAERSNRCGLMMNGVILAEDSPKSILAQFGVQNLEEAFLALCLSKKSKVTDSKSNEAHSTSSAITLDYSKSAHSDVSSSQMDNKIVNFDKRKTFSGQTFNALFKKELIRIRRQPGEIFFTILLPLIKGICFIFTMGRNPTGLTIGIVNNEIPDVNFCSEYLESTNYKFINDSCYFENLSCYFLNEIKDDTATKIVYNSFDEAYQSAKAANVYGFLSIASNFTEAISKRKSDWQPLDDDVFLDQIEVFLDHDNLQIASFLKLKLLKSFENFNRKLLRQCDLNEHLEDNPISIETYYGDFDSDYVKTMMPALFIQTIILSGILFSLSSIAQNRTGGVWNRTILAGVTVSEILSVQFALLFLSDLVQLIVLKIIVSTLFDHEPIGSQWLLGFFCLMVYMTGSSIGIFISILTNNLLVLNSAGLVIFFFGGCLCGGMWPIAGQPEFLQYFSSIIPTTLPSVTFKNIVSKGFGMSHYTIYGGFAVLSGYIGLMLILSFWSLKKTKYTEQHWWRQIKEGIVNTCNTELGIKKDKREDYIRESTWNAIDQRKEVNVKLLNCNESRAEELSKQYALLNKRVKREVRNDWRRHLNGLAEKAQTASDCGNMKDLYNTIKELSDRSGRKQVPIKSKEGRILVTVDEQAARWKEHFEEVLNVQRNGICIEAVENPPALPIDTRPPTKKEIIEAVKRLKSGKAAGMDEIPAEVLKADANVTANFLKPLFDEIWSLEKYPEEWKEGLIVKLPKKGDLSSCSNWRGITLLSVISKVFMSVILQRLMDPIETRLRKEQAGFRPYRSCIDQISTLRIIVEQSIEWQSALYLVFIDYEKAFDSIDRECIWTELRNLGVPEKLIRLIREAYDGFRCRVLHESVQSESFVSLTGVRQGDLLSPLLFLVIMDKVMRSVTRGKPRGIVWSLNDRLEDLDYADDACLLTHTHQDMQGKLRDLEFESAKVGLVINVKKTEEIRINAKNNAPLYIGEQTIKRVQHFTYLGSNVSADGGTRKDVEQRIQKARGAFSKLSNIWRSTSISKALKMKIFNACVNIKMNSVEVRGAIKCYGKKTFVLNNLNLTVQSGLIYSLIGPSGCGKTTLLKCILGMKQLDSGTINVLGQEVSCEKPSKFAHLIGYMPQETALVPELTIKETLNYFGNIHRMDQDSLGRRFAIICTLLELRDVNRRVEYLSGGEKRRVSFAAALIHDPKIVVLDEPTVGLDSILREKIWAFLIDSTRSSDMTVIITTHYIAEAEKSNCCGFMKNGKLLMENSPENIFHNLGVSNLENAFYELCCSEKLALKRQFPENNLKNSIESSIGSTVIKSQPLIDDKIHVEDEKNFNAQTIKALLVKEFLRVRRQPAEIILTLLVPVLQVFIYALSIGKNPIGLHIGIVNNEIMDINFCSEYLKSVNYQFNSSSCSFEYLSCHFLNEITDDTVIKVNYHTYDEAFRDAKAGKIQGVITIASNFTETMTERKIDWEAFGGNQTDLDQIVVNLDHGNLIILKFLQYRLSKSFEAFNKKLLHLCGLNENLENSPINIDGFYGTLNDDFTITLVPGLFAQVMMLSGTLFSISAIAQCRIEGIWNRTLLSGVKSSEIVLAHIITFVISDVLQVIILKIASVVLFNYEILGSQWTLGSLCLVMCLVGSSIGLFISILTNNLIVVNSAGMMLFFACGSQCGVFWPMEAQPKILQYFGYCLPIAIPAISIRNIIAKGFDITHYTVYGGFITCFIWIFVMLTLCFMMIRRKRYSD